MTRQSHPSPSPERQVITGPVLAGAAEITNETPKARHRRKQLERYRRLREEGTCVTCGHAPAVEGRRLCERCDAARMLEAGKTGRRGAELTVLHPRTDEELSVLRRYHVDDCTPGDDDPVCLALVDVFPGGMRGPEVAQVCGWSVQWQRCIEASALRRLRRRARLEGEGGPLRELLAAIDERRDRERGELW